MFIDMLMSDGGYDGRSQKGHGIQGLTASISTVPWWLSGNGGAGMR